MIDTVKLAAVLASIGGLAFLLGIALVLISPPALPAPPPTAPTVEVTLIGGEVDGKFAFGLKGQPLTSPGPAIKVKLGATVRIVFVNEGNIPHSFAVVSEAKELAEPLFGSAIGSPTAPILPKGSGSITFKVDRPGRFSYICTVPGHVTLGMYGEFIVEE